MRVEPVRVKLLSRDPSSINCYVEIFINSTGYEMKFEAEGGGASKMKGPIYDHFHKIHSHKRKDDDDDEDEEDYSAGSDHRTEWEKLAEKFGGETNQSSEQHKVGDSNKYKGKQQQDFGEVGDLVLSDLIVHNYDQTVVKKNSPDDKSSEIGNSDQRVKSAQEEMDESETSGGNNSTRLQKELDSSEGALSYQDKTGGSDILDIKEHEDWLDQSGKGLQIIPYIPGKDLNPYTQTIQQNLVVAESSTQEGHEYLAANQTRSEGLGKDHEIINAMQIVPLAYSFPTLTEVELTDKAEEVTSKDVPTVSHNEPISKGKNLIVHTEQGPSVVAASLWPCLHYTSNKKGVVAEQKSNMPEASLKSGSPVKQRARKSELVDLVNTGVEVKKITDDCLSETDIDVGAENVEGWVSPKKKGRRTKILEPPVATRKSSRIQNQGIPMEKKASRLKSIQNLEHQVLEDSNQRGGKGFCGLFPEKL